MLKLDSLFVREAASSPVLWKLGSVTNLYRPDLSGPTLDLGRHPLTLRKESTLRV